MGKMLVFLHGEVATWEIVIWEVSAWEVAQGKMLLGKYLTPFLQIFFRLKF